MSPSGPMTASSASRTGVTSTSARRSLSCATTVLTESVTVLVSRVRILVSRSRIGAAASSRNAKPSKDSTACWQPMSAATASSRTSRSGSRSSWRTGLREHVVHPREQLGELVEACRREQLVLHGRHGGGDFGSADLLEASGHPVEGGDELARDVLAGQRQVRDEAVQGSRQVEAGHRVRRSAQVGAESGGEPGQRGPDEVDGRAHVVDRLQQRRNVDDRRGHQLIGNAEPQVHGVDRGLQWTGIARPGDERERILGPAHQTANGSDVEPGEDRAEDVEQLGRLRMTRECGERPHGSGELGGNRRL